MPRAQAEDPEWRMDVGGGAKQAAGLVDVLGELPFFDMLSGKDLRKVERIVHRRMFGPGEVVMRAWVPRSGMFAIRLGSVRVVRTRADGSQEVVGHLGRGALLGEFSLLDDSPRSTSIVASEPSELVGFFRPDLMDLMQTDPDVGFKILYRLSQIMAGQLQENLGELRTMRRALESAGVDDRRRAQAVGDAG